MSRPCGCRLGANQHAAWVVPCGEHGQLIRTAAALLNITPEEFMRRAVAEHVERVA